MVSFPLPQALRRLGSLVGALRHHVDDGDRLRASSGSTSSSSSDSDPGIEFADISKSSPSTRRDGRCDCKGDQDQDQDRGKLKEDDDDASDFRLVIDIDEGGGGISNSTPSRASPCLPLPSLDKHRLWYPIRRGKEATMSSHAPWYPSPLAQEITSPAGASAAAQTIPSAISGASNLVPVVGEPDATTSAPATSAPASTLAPHPLPPPLPSVPGEDEDEDAEGEGEGGVEGFPIESSERAESIHISCTPEEYFSTLTTVCASTSIKSQGLPIRFRDISVLAHAKEGRGRERLVRTFGSSLVESVTWLPEKLGDGVGWVLKKYGGGKKGVGWLRSEWEQRIGMEVPILHTCDGVVNQGEMLLIQGRPSSGVTTLLRALTSSWEGYSHVSGSLDYALLKPDEIESHLRGEVCFLDALDGHFASLSVGETLRLASGCRVPRSRPKVESLRLGEGEDGLDEEEREVSKVVGSRKGWREWNARSVARILGLSHTWLTPVGNELIRGVSGGERKRVSVAELLLVRPSVLALDNVTSGLDSSTAVQLVQLLKTFAVDGRRSVVAGLRQVGESVYDKFDKVIVLNAGRQVYYGPTGDAKVYFEDMGFESFRGQTTSDFLNSCTDVKTRRVREGWEDKVPKNAREMEERWLGSEMRKRVLREFEEYEIRYGGSTSREGGAGVEGEETPAEHVKRSVLREKDSLIPLPQKSRYTVNFFRQVILLTRRQYCLILADLRPYLVKTSVNVLLSILVGTLFLQLPRTTSAAFTRGSVLMLSLLFNGYLQLAELGNTLVGRPIVKRQREFGMYMPSALAMARTLGDLPLIAAQVVIFASVTYWLAGLQPKLENFLIYLLFVYATALNLTTVFRMFAAFSPSFDEAMRYCGIALNLFVVYAGYFIPVPSMRPWLRWIHYVIDPISYSYEAVLANEFNGLELQCSEEHIVPRGPGYDDPNYQTCAVPGSKPRSLTVRGEDYIREAFNFSYDHVWRDLGIILLLAVVFLFIGVVATDLFHFAPAGSVRLFARTKAAKRRLEEKARTRRAAPVHQGTEEDQPGVNGHSVGGLEYANANGVDHQEYLPEDDATEEDVDISKTTTNGSFRTKAVVDRESSAVLTWRNVELTVKLSDNSTRQLLNDLSGYIKPGECTALMGASGAGKTTLLNALAGRSGAAIIRGDILFDGQSPTGSFYRSTGFVEQMDLHDDRCTIREALEFSAVLRQSSDIPRAEKIAYVDVVLDLLDLVHLQDALVGSVNEGLGLEERKRLSIAAELVSRPSILFLDEPTSGLDSQSAYRIVKLMQRLARTNLAVLATIHQPSAEIFGVFDKFLLLEKGGRQAYFGPRDAAVAYFEERGAQSVPNQNPAEFLLDAVGAGMAGSGRPATDVATEWSKLWHHSDECVKVLAEVDDLVSKSAGKGAALRSGFPPRRGAGHFTQAYELTKRVSRNFWRDASFSYTKMFTAVAVALIIGLTFFQLENSIAGLQNRMFATFLILFCPPVFMNQIIIKMFAMRGLWESREKPSHIYGTFAFCTSFLLSELPYAIICGVVFFCIWYFMVGFPLEIGVILYCYGMVQLFFIFQSTWAAWITALAPTLGTVANLLPFFLVSMEAFNGSLMPYHQMPGYWRWLYWVSPFQWYVKGVLGTALHGLPVRCTQAELVHFQPPPSTTCGQYADSFLWSHAGYLANPSSATSCEYCKFSVGDDFLSILNIWHSDRWLAMGVFGAYTLTNIILVYAFSNFNTSFFKPLFSP